MNLNLCLKGMMKRVMSAIDTNALKDRAKLELKLSLPA